MADIFQEVDEDLRRDKHEELWAKYGKYVIAVALAIVLATAANVGWREYSKSQRLADGERFAAAKALVGEGREAEAVAAFATLAADAGGGYAVIAKFEQATAQARSGDIAAAVGHDPIDRMGMGFLDLRKGQIIAFAVTAQGGFNERFLGRKVMMDARLGDAYCLRQVRIAEPGIAASADQPFSLFEQSGSRVGHHPVMSSLVVCRTYRSKREAP